MSLESEGLPLADLAVAALADEIWALDVRPGSKTAAVLGRWLASRGGGEAAVGSRLYCFGGGERLFPPAAGDTRCPAIAAVPDPPGDPLGGTGTSLHELREAACRAMRWAGPSATACLAPALCGGAARAVAAAEGRYLVHCTRGRQGSLPGQSSAGYAAELLLCPADVDASPLETLVRILRSGKIAATSLLKRGAAASVSFAEVPLGELLARRAYQGHLRRWDWEPYGLAIRREALSDRFGARPVRYLPAAEYWHLTEGERWLFQPADERGRDWTAEREWRCRGDVRLSTLDFADAVVFVSSQAEASLLQRFSRFAVMAVGHP